MACQSVLRALIWRRVSPPAWGGGISTYVCSASFAILRKILPSNSRPHEAIRILAAAGRLAHSLRGTAGNIGAKDVAQACALLEQACHDGEPATQVQALAMQVEHCLHPILAALADLKADKPAGAGENPQNDSAISEQLNRLIALLDEGDTTALDVLAALRNMPLDRALAERLTLAAAQVELFDFDRALKILQ